VAALAVLPGGGFGLRSSPGHAGQVICPDRTGTPIRTPRAAAQAATEAPARGAGKAQGRRRGI